MWGGWGYETVFSPKFHGLSAGATRASSGPFPMWVCYKEKETWMKLRCGQEGPMGIFTWRMKSSKASPQMKILAAVELGGVGPLPGPCCPPPARTLLVWLP